MSMTRLTCLPVRVVCFGISSSVALGGGTGCWALAAITVSMAAAMPASKTAFVFMEILPVNVWMIMIRAEALSSVYR
jgi:hypothetical protein